MSDDTFYYLLLSLGANVFFFVAVFFQHRHIERVCKQNCALNRAADFWRAKWEDK